MDVKTYYTAPPLRVFNDIKRNAIRIWNTYDDTYGYRSEKLKLIKDLKNIKDNAWFMVAMFDPDNQAKLVTMVQPETATMILDAMGLI